MNEATARAAAENARPQYQVPPGAKLFRIEQRYIELPQQNPEMPGPVQDVLVWVARFLQVNSWVDLAVRDSDGKIVRVERSRQAVLMSLAPGVVYPLLTEHHLALKD